MYEMARVTSRPGGPGPRRCLSPRSGAIRSLALVVLACAASGSCSGATRDGLAPEATLASSTAAQNEIRPLLKDWGRSSREERARMETRLVAFRSRFPKDDLAHMADALLAWIALDRGDLKGAWNRARRVQAQGPGTTSNPAIVMEGAVLRREGRHKEALARLTPLQNKLIDAYARELLHEELVAAAVGAKSWDLGAKSMALWLREASDQAAVKSRVEALLTQVPPSELERILDRRLEGEPTADDRELSELIAQRLAALARETRDVRLAKHLLAKSGTLLGDQGNPVAQLASGAGAARVEALTVGLLISLRDDTLRRRGVEAASGLAHGLGVPTSAARFVSRDDGGSLDRVADALTNLSAEGAAIVVAGLDTDEANLTARFAATHELPVILLRPPSTPSTSPFVFVLGEDPAAVRDALASGLESRGAGAVVVVGEGRSAAQVDADATNTQGGAPGAGCGPLPLQAWKKAGVSGVILNAAPLCAQAAIQDLKASGLAVKLGIGFDLWPQPPPQTLLAGAGLYPLLAYASTPPAMARWIERGRATPSWWAGLGRDAGVLAWEGIRGLPGNATEDPKGVRERHRAAAAGLAKATGELWTTEARGFAGARVMPRTITVHEGR
jgi:Periplasmic binding protein